MNMTVIGHTAPAGQSFLTKKEAFLVSVPSPVQLAGPTIPCQERQEKNLRYSD